MSAVRIRLLLGYDGGGFAGWAKQPGKRTVAETLAEALGRVLRLGEPARLTVAGRTDAGVHARGQVAHFDLPPELWAAQSARLPWRLHGVLPADVRVFRSDIAAPGFDARFSALWRRYSFRICDDFTRFDPLERHHTVWHRRPLDLAAMNDAATRLLGEQDFAAFCRHREGATTRRALQKLEWRRDTRGIAIADVVADAFCHNMVRALVGALVAVGAGQRPPDWPAALLAARVRDPAVRVLPAHGLCLEEVGYPPNAELAARADQTRRLRGC